MNGFGIAGINVGVVGEDVACGVGAGGAIGDATGFYGGGGIGDGDGRSIAIASPSDGEGNVSGQGCESAIGDPHRTEGVGSGSAVSEGLSVWIAVVQGIGDYA